MRRLSLNRSEPAKKSGQNIPKNRCLTTIAERMVETLAELPFIGDQVVCLSHDLRRDFGSRATSAKRGGRKMRLLRSQRHRSSVPSGYHRATRIATVVMV